MKDSAVVRHFSLKVADNAPFLPPNAARPVVFGASIGLAHEPWHRNLT